MPETFKTKDPNLFKVNLGSNWALVPYGLGRSTQSKKDHKLGIK